MKNKYVTSFLALLLFALSCGGCHRQKETGIKKVAIATLMTHPALDADIQNMKLELQSEGFKEGETIQYIVGNANGDPNLAVTVVRELDRQNPAVLVPITTPVAQVAVKQAKSPIVFSAVTDPVGAGVVPSLNSPPAGITGVSDAWPYQAQLNLARQIVPTAKRLAVVFNPGESASQYGIVRIREIAPTLGFDLVEVPVSNSQEILGALRLKIRSVDAVYLSSDNTVIEGMPAALSVCLDNKKPLFVGDSGTVEKGGLAAVSVGYAGVGRSTGRLVARMLRGERSIPVVVANGDEIFLNLDTAKRIGLVIPESVRQHATRIFGEQ